MNRGHLDAQNYRFDFAEVVVDEMVKAAGGEVSEAKVSDDENEATLSEVFG